MSQSRFDQAAATWDEDPGRVRMSRNIAEAMLAAVPVQPSMTAIDFGCGTGLVTLALQPFVGRIVGIDSSPGMLAKLRGKAEAIGAAHVEALHVDLTAQSAPAGLRADLIVSAMALHHIADIPHLLQTLAGLLVPGGYMALADLDTEDGAFHGDSTGVHHSGLDREWLMTELTALGFFDLRATTAHVVERPGNDTPRRYPVFLVSGRKGAT
jgi:predicted TPR repeat methyltransferase